MFVASIPHEKKECVDVHYIFLEMHHLTSEVYFQIGIRIVCRFLFNKFFLFFDK